MITIGIIGHGFVGKAISSTCIIVGSANTRGVNRLIIVDPAENKPISRMKGLKFDVIFISVPTPSREDGTIDSSIVDDTLEYLKKNVYYEVIAIKSTLTPDLVEEYCRDPKIVYNPEFLTEKNAVGDFKTAKTHVIGATSKASANYLETIYKTYFDLHPTATFIKVLPKEASFIKYGINSYLASKVAWFNEFYDVVQASGLDQDSYNKIISVMSVDDRVGTSHMAVPGWDGNRGFGGACFPKDIPAFIYYSQKQGYDPKILKTSWNYNVTLRTKNGGLLDREIAQNIQYKKI